MRTRICKDCGKQFEVPTGRVMVLCPDCAKKAKKNSVLRERTCKACETTFLGYPRSFYCRICSAERKEQQRKSYNRRKPARPLGSTDLCKACGKPYIVNSGRQRYCPECSKEVVRGNINAHKREYMQKNKEKIQEIKAETCGKRYVCAFCGKEFEKHGPEVTCSEECAAELKRIQQNKADIKRGKRKIPADQRYDSGFPQSGVVGVTWRKNGKWQATYKKHYIGVYNTIEDAKKAIEEFKGKNEGQE